ncbi:MAG: phosphoglycerate mutase [SAR202 cluster bacterium Casp-Chloro-G4]|nr:2,3-bisphosphoglycerate-independent phosphoglycerate mutase [Chloroflexota bacterium]MDA1228617.1 2,3-bisphosphoglycerate-independent phosphoglycerate mutase [Chloroflexota bacterium]PKB61977.1 MAG: phosphoglycerate mutase [SAR202 cluster bacterium Casp-Chloro-G4]
MIDLPFLSDICRTTPSKIVLLVADGLGGAPHPDTGKSELETANLPNLDALAGESSCGLTTPVMTGITPGSGPGHMALFGYDPIKYLMGRGVLEALGIDVELGPGDVSSRGNFCTLDGDGLLVDRRAGRIPTAESAPLVELLDQIEVPGVSLSVYPVQDYRFVLVIRGEGLDDGVSETDPQVVGEAPLVPHALNESSRKAAEVVKAFAAAAQEVLGGRDRANMVLLRGFSKLPHLPDFGESYSLNPGAVAAYPMYRGLAKLVGMNVIPTGRSFDDELDTLEKNFDKHDFFFLHYKPADAAGEDGDFEAKVKCLEELDERIPRLRGLGPDVLVVAGDHATPAIMAGHSWHPVPVMINSDLTKGDGSPAFHERSCSTGSLGRLPATELMLLAMAHAGKLVKYGP